MGWKEFLKPDWRKILLFIITMGGLNYFWITGTLVCDARILVGLPLGFYPIGSFMIWPGSSTPSNVEFSWINFAIDILFWYILACTIFYAYDAIKNKRKTKI